jgi:hypothetical protein
VPSIFSQALTLPARRFFSTVTKWNEFHANYFEVDQVVFARMQDYSALIVLTPLHEKHLDRMTYAHPMLPVAIPPFQGQRRKENASKRRLENQAKY